MIYADAIPVIQERREAFGWSRAELARKARQSPLSIRKFLAGIWPDTDYRDFIQGQLEAALDAEAKRREIEQRRREVLG